MSDTPKGRQITTWGEFVRSPSRSAEVWETMTFLNFAGSVAFIIATSATHGDYSIAILLALFAIISMLKSIADRLRVPSVIKVPDEPPKAKESGKATG